MSEAKDFRGLLSQMVEAKLRQQLEQIAEVQAQRILKELTGETLPATPPPQAKNQLDLFNNERKKFRSWKVMAPPTAVLQISPKAPSIVGKYKETLFQKVWEETHMSLLAGSKERMDLTRELLLKFPMMKLNNVSSYLSTYIKKGNVLVVRS